MQEKAVVEEIRCRWCKVPLLRSVPDGSYFCESCREAKYELNTVRGRRRRDQAKLVWFERKDLHKYNK